MYAPWNIVRKFKKKYATQSWQQIYMALIEVVAHFHLPYKDLSLKQV